MSRDIWLPAPSAAASRPSGELSTQVLGTKERAAFLRQRGRSPHIVSQCGNVSPPSSCSGTPVPTRGISEPKNLHQFSLEAGQAGLRLLPGAKAVSLSQGMRRLSPPNSSTLPLGMTYHPTPENALPPYQEGKKAYLGPGSLGVTALPKRDMHMGTIPCIVSTSDFSHLGKSRMKLPNTLGDLCATLSPFTSWCLGHAEP